MKENANINKIFNSKQIIFIYVTIAVILRGAKNLFCYLGVGCRPGYSFQVLALPA